MNQLVVLSEIQSDIEAIKNSNTLYDEISFADRSEAIDNIDFHIIERIDQLLMGLNPPEELLELKQDASDLKKQLETIDNKLFTHIRSNIQSGVYTGMPLMHEIDKCLTHNKDAGSQSEEAGYDNLDLLINGIFPVQDIPVETKEREPEMVFYQKTPARIIFELAEKAHFLETDIFYDLGAGLGQVVILMNLLKGVRSIGVEFEPEFCNYSRVCASELNLNNIEFINEDARFASFSDGTVFFMYTPFVGDILQEVLEILRKESQAREIRIFTYGPCTLQVAKQSWLISVTHNESGVYRLSEFRSFEI